MSSDTIYALATGRPPAAIAVVRVSGPKAHEAGRMIAGELPPPRMAAVRQLMETHGSGKIDEGLVLRFDAPTSHTGEDIIEFQCHGSRAVVDKLLAELAGIDGLRLAEPGEFTRRAFGNGRIDLTEAEGLADLIEAETEAQRRAALQLAEGGLRRQISTWQERLLALSARAEAAIDYAEEDDVRSDPRLASDAGELAKELAEWLDRPPVEPLKNGVAVVIAGPPNAGKSSLVNALAGTDKAIVTDVPGTTRDRIEVPLSVSGLPVRLIDTAGLRESDDQVERMGVELAQQAVQEAEVLLWLGEPDAAPEHPRLLRVHSKADDPDRCSTPRGSLAVSAKTGAGLNFLLGKVAEAARAVLPAEDALSLNRRQAAHIATAQRELEAVRRTVDWVLIAEHLRAARTAFDRLTGRAGVEDVLDALFGRFCLGK